jgi:hypothetical protein
MATGKERREERREKATKGEIDLLIAMSSSCHHDASQHPPPPAPSPTIPPHPSIALTLSRFKIDSNQSSPFPGFPEGIYLHLRLVKGMILKVAI